MMLMKARWRSSQHMDADKLRADGMEISKI